ncbi:hypothetical protein GCM10023187_34940 [Nibrella viscosa]|uniref:Toxin-antitoxin system antitoxin component, TIGR02293 family n=1 Tax=Nibrella viscosa TaxID=1084524 RepID=A0ABP8KMU3_9BACT
MELLTDNIGSETSFELVDQARQGVLRLRVDEVARPVSLTDRDMAHILGISERTLHRLQPQARLASGASERLLLLENLLAHGLAVFDGRAEVLGRWLRIPLPELRRQAPLEFLDTTIGFALVHQVLSRIEHGIYA